MANLAGSFLHCPAQLYLDGQLTLPQNESDLGSLIRRLAVLALDQLHHIVRDRVVLFGGQSPEAV
jgi:hypothetical protein